MHTNPNTWDNITICVSKNDIIATWQFLIYIHILTIFFFHENDYLGQNTGQKKLHVLLNFFILNGKKSHAGKRGSKKQQ